MNGALKLEIPRLCLGLSGSATPPVFASLSSSQVECLRPGEVGVELHAMRESLLHFHVHTVIAFGADRLIGRNVAEIRILAAHSAGSDGRGPVVLPAR